MAAIGRRRLVLALALAVAGCASTMASYRALSDLDREAYEACALERCGPAPQWKGEAMAAVRAYEHERDAHVACWDVDLDRYVAIGSSEARRAWLHGRCQRQLQLLPSPIPSPRM